MPHESISAVNSARVCGHICFSCPNRNAVLTAFSEVENALSGVSRLQAQMEHSPKRRDILARTLEFAHDRYQAGYASYL